MFPTFLTHPFPCRVLSRKLKPHLVADTVKQYISRAQRTTKKGSQEQQNMEFLRGVYAFMQVSRSSVSVHFLYNNRTNPCELALLLYRLWLIDWLYHTILYSTTTNQLELKIKSIISLKPNRFESQKKTKTAKQKRKAKANQICYYLLLPIYLYYYSTTTTLISVTNEPTKKTKYESQISREYQMYLTL